MPDYSVTVRDETTGETVHLSQENADSVRVAAAQAAETPLEMWDDGPAALEFYQLDPELDTFSFAFYGKLEDAQSAGLRHFREHKAAMNQPVQNIRYVQVPKRESDPGRPDLWRIVDEDRPAVYITICQIVKYELWPDDRTNHDPASAGPQY